MRLKVIAVGTLMFASLLAAHAQKIRVGYDKTADFSKYHTFSWVKTDTERTFRQVAIMGEIDQALKKKGLTAVEDGGDLLLSAAGSIGGDVGGQHQEVIAPVPANFYYPTATVWSGVPVAPGNLVISGTLVLDLIDSQTKTIVWQGSVSEKMDNDNRTKNIERVRKAIVKLVDNFPPKK